MDLDKVKFYEASISDQRHEILRLKEDLATVQRGGLVFTRLAKNEYGNSMVKNYEVRSENQAVKIARLLVVDELKAEISKAEQTLQKLIKVGVPNE